MQPKRLPSAIKRLRDRELDLLLAAVLVEQERRGRKPAMSAESSPKRRVKAAAVSDPCEDQRLQGRRDAVTDCAALRDFPVGCAQGAGA